MTVGEARDSCGDAGPRHPPAPRGKRPKAVGRAGEITQTPTRESFLHYLERLEPPVSSAKSKGLPTRPPWQKGEMTWRPAPTRTK